MLPVISWSLPVLSSESLESPNQVALCLQLLKAPQTVVIGIIWITKSIDEVIRSMMKPFMEYDFRHICHDMDVQISAQNDTQSQYRSDPPITRHQILDYTRWYLTIISINPSGIGRIFYDLTLGCYYIFGERFAIQK